MFDGNDQEVTAIANTETGDQKLYAHFKLDQTRIEAEPIVRTILKNTTLASLSLIKKKINTDLLRKMMRGNQVFKFEQTEPLWLDLLTKDYRDVLKQTTIPILFISGELSPLFPTQLTDYYVQTAKHAKSFLAKGSGHLPYAESPDETNQVLLAFLRENGGSEF